MSLRWALRMGRVYEMAELSNVIAYICQRYPHKDELSKARLTKMVYLADWRSAITQGRQMTDVQWVFNHYGPYVDDIVQVAREDPAFDVIQTANLYGDHKEVIHLCAATTDTALTRQERDILDFVISTCAPLSWNDFIRLVYSTYPIMTQPRYSRLDLSQLANEYKASELDTAETV